MDCPKPLVFEPLRHPHNQTFILLHGRGSSGDKFGPVLLETQMRSTKCASSEPPGDNTEGSPPTMTLREAFPHARFVFPTAARRRATLYKRSLTHQWFDNWTLDPPATQREELQAPGLAETTAYLHGLLRDEIALVPGGAGNVVLGGLSQGCAASLTAVLLWEGERLGAVVGMCGWLPFVERLMEQADERKDGDVCGLEDGFDPFERDDEDEEGDTESSPAATAVGWLAEELGLSSTASPSALLELRELPVFLGHGLQDDTVSVLLGRRASQFWSTIGGRVSWKEYDPLGHWYSGEMLRDVVDFVRRQPGWSIG